ncbi:PGC-1 and ERR-induced regulator in muscle protein 1 [Vulpes lagopus]
MENFQYSIQLSDQDWAEFSATAEECGLLQASLASGDELLSSDIDQGDRSGSSPLGPPPLLEGQPGSQGRGWPSFKKEDKAATRPLVSRSWHEPGLALGADQQMPSTSTLSEALLSLGSDAAPPGQSSSLLGPVSSRDKMQKLLQGPASQGPAPSPSGEPPQSSESPGCSTAPQKPPGSPGALPCSPSRKKRRSAGAKGGRCLSTPDSARTQLGSLLLADVKPKEDLGLAGSRGKGLSAETAEQTAGTGQDELGPDSAGAPAQVTRQGTDLDLSTPVPTTEQGGPQEKPREEEASAGTPGHHSGEPPLGPVQAPKKKKVRFSMAVPSPEEPGSGDTSPPSPATAQPSSPRTTVGARGGPGAWDAMAVGPRSPQPRILKHLPPPSPSASVGPRPRSSFAVTLPEAYEFLFCDTIEEEDEQAEEEAEAGQALAEVQWPDTCEFFFQDCRAQRSGPRGSHSVAQPPPAEPVPAPPPGDPVPISIPEAYEHFLGEDSSGGLLELAAFLQRPATEHASLVPWGVGPGTLPEPSPATAEQLSLAVKQAGEPRDLLTSFTFSQNDMCLVFVAFATWAVRTSDLHTPDAWKTVLLANIGTISAIHYFRRQVGQVRRSRSRSRSRSPSPSPSS